jgi:predicted GNAT superfamily acetyltransferase
VERSEGECVSSGAAEIEIRHCATIDEYKACVRLESVIWGIDTPVPTSMFVVAHHTGGQVLGAFGDGKMIGFTMAVAGVRGPQPFLHSHMTAVLPEYRDQGVGRRLKLFQRQDALKRGIRLVEWTFDPLELKNAHFNLVRLGAVARRFIPNCYGITESPLHVGLPTDRLVAEWWLDSDRVKNILADNAVPAKDTAARIALPSNLGDLKVSDRDTGARVQTSAREQFQKYFSDGYAATGIERRDGSTSEYILERTEEVSGLKLPPAAH